MEKKRIRNDLVHDGNIRVYIFILTNVTACACEQLPIYKTILDLVDMQYNH